MIPLPEPAAHHVYWKEDNDSCSWDQWHDASDPFPADWGDDEAPDEVTPYFTADQLRAYAAACVEEANRRQNASWSLMAKKMVEAERERAALVCDDEARIRTEAGNTHPEESDSRGRCFAGARAAINCAKGVRNGEVVDAAIRAGGDA